MSGPEQVMWDVLRPVLASAGLDPIRVENRVHPGFPDVNYADGVLELKAMTRWPKSDEDPVVIEHFTPQQRVVLKRRWLHGGSAWLLLRVSSEHEWLLFDGWTAAEIVGASPRPAHRSSAARVIVSSAGRYLTEFIPWLANRELSEHREARRMRLRARTPVSAVAAALGWQPPHVLEVEDNRGSVHELTTLLDYWRS